MDTFDRGFSTADKLFTLGQLLKVVHGVKEFTNVHSNQDFPRLEIIVRWGHLPISMILLSERSLKLKMLSLARTSKYVNDTVLSIKKFRGGQLGLKGLAKLDSYCSHRIVVSNKTFMRVWMGVGGWGLEFSNQ